MLPAIGDSSVFRRRAGAYVSEPDCRVDASFCQLSGSRLTAGNEDWDCSIS